MLQSSQVIERFASRILSYNKLQRISRRIFLQTHALSEYICYKPYRERLKPLRHLEMLRASCEIPAFKLLGSFAARLLTCWLVHGLRVFVSTYGCPSMGTVLWLYNLKLPNSAYWEVCVETFRPLSIKNQRETYVIREPAISPLRPPLSPLRENLTCGVVSIDKYIILGTFSLDPFREYRKRLGGISDMIAGEHARMIDAFSLRDRLVWGDNYLRNMAKRSLEKIAYYKRLSIELIKAEFTFMSPALKHGLVTLLVHGGMIDTVHQLLTPDIVMILELSDVCIQQAIGIPVFITTQETPLNRPYHIRIKDMNTSDKVKEKAFDMLNIIKKSNDSAPKAQQYLDRLLQIPFGNYKQEAALTNPSSYIIEQFNQQYPDEQATSKDILAKIQKYMPDLEDTWKKLNQKQVDYLDNVSQLLDASVHGHDEAKMQMKRLIAQWMRGTQDGMVIGLQGPPGNGKTTLIKNGLAKCLVDEDGNTRPVGYISLGGASCGSSLHGHSYTYQGSKCGRIAEILIESKCMNPIILFDELDKVSKTEYGREIIGVLTHLTDSTQNKEFNDKYFDGVPLDLSRAIIIFTFNDLDAIDRILRDRITIVKTKPLSLLDKIAVTRSHILPELEKAIGVDDTGVEVTENVLSDLIRDYTAEAGARQLKQLLYELVRELNLRRIFERRLYPSTCKLQLTQELIDDLFKYKNKITHRVVTDTNIVGQINGMYANVLEMGGIMPIQVSKIKKNNFLEMELTGSQGDVMKESMACAKTVAWLLVKEQQKVCLSKKQEFGIHIHCPSASTPKDGPSAGGAICLAILSILTNKPIKQRVAMTGEIDIKGNITAIGGLGAKLNGAKLAGIAVAIIPKENLPQLEQLRQQHLSPEDDSFRVELVDSIQDAIPICLTET